MKLMRKHPGLYDLNLGPVNRVVGHAKHCTGCLVANRRLGARAAYHHCLTKVATQPGECYFADVAGPIRPLGIGGAKYILVAVDAYTRFLHVMPKHRKAQAASLLAQLFERVRVQVIRKQNNGVHKLHTDKGGEFMSRDLQTFCAWRGIVHTLSDTVAHQSNGVAERRVGQLTTGIRSCLLRSCPSPTGCGHGKQQCTLHMPKTCFQIYSRVLRCSPRQCWAIAGPGSVALWLWCHDCHCSTAAAVAI